ncbi:hypothetical protein D1872_280740 [compost metagenome]
MGDVLLYGCGNGGNADLRKTVRYVRTEAVFFIRYHHIFDRFGIMRNRAKHRSTEHLPRDSGDRRRSVDADCLHDYL